MNIQLAIADSTATNSNAPFVFGTVNWNKCYNYASGTLAGGYTLTT